MYWAVVGTFIGIATLVNFTNYILYRQRLSAANRGDPQPAKPKSWIFRANASATAIIREASNATLAPITIKGHRIRMPTLGPLSIICANVIMLLVLCFFKFDLNDLWTFEMIGYRTGCMSVAQLPLIILLAGKHNIIGYLTGTSYERLNCLHRWASRCLLLTVTIHMGYWFADWAPYNYIEQKVRTDPITKHGLISWCLLVWLCISSMTPIRGWRYEVFVIQHIGSFAVFLAFVYKHISSWPMYIRVYVWIPIALVCFDRVLRAGFMLYANLSIFHPKQKRQGTMSGLWACNAEFTALSNNATRITIRNPPIGWYAGQHVFLSCHSVVPLQAHPFTIASIPEDDKMEFLVQTKSGGTKRLFKYAEKVSLLPTSAADTVKDSKSVAIQGPYGCIRPLRQFDSVVLLAGSTGATFTVPLLRDILAHWKHEKKHSGVFSAPQGAVTRHIRFVWVVKSRGQLSWFTEQLTQVAEDVQTLRAAGQSVDVEMSVYITCDPSFTEEHKSMLSNNPVPSRGAVEEISEAEAMDEKLVLEKQNRQDKFEVRELEDATAASILDGKTGRGGGACGPDGVCCCTATIEDEDDAIEPAVCTCNCGSAPSSLPSAAPGPEKKLSTAGDSTTTSPSSDSSDATFVKAKQQPLLHPSIMVLSGRPQPRTIIRKTLEQALGESAVVVCGPAGLVGDVRMSVVALSDERAVHKGTGAQGVYLHAEAFGY
ncbi:uncharacterized protein K452DRAFT_238602 [Aplosporella prunicola CBS 121167]|uniref:ferric-chelate reductase (NADPH) n=1 Tax=Aplosporella prunicola CBS 121167 TaxID=1176127 RepID=A0A6A6AW77_9PEZI|nr:uncharacterized protein K452DRAFT_238602 [Aplosporella prunicola CBS 121167]KAF2135846.1 hypothetical protein K452DRAFT_238602 [Aplosporella prunicola CBS 121167]